MSYSALVLRQEWHMKKVSKIKRREKNLRFQNKYDASVKCKYENAILRAPTNNGHLNFSHKFRLITIRKSRLKIIFLVAQQFKPDCRNNLQFYSPDEIFADFLFFFLKGRNILILHL